MLTRMVEPNCVVDNIYYVNQVAQNRINTTARQSAYQGEGGGGHSNRALIIYTKSVASHGKFLENSKQVW
jgi:hypothetical protein